MKPFIYIVILFQTMVSLGFSNNDNMEAIEDSLKFLEIKKMQLKFSNKIVADIETYPVKSLNGDDAADDMAIYCDPYNPNKSVILATNKKGGIHLYNLDGVEIKFYPLGKINNIDLRYGFDYKGVKNPIVAVTNRSVNVVSLFIYNPSDYDLSNSILDIKTGLNEVYGVALHKNMKGEFFVIVSDKDGKIEYWQIISLNDSVSAKLRSTLNMQMQTEGMVVDDNTNIAYIAVEDKGIYSYNLGESLSKPLLIKSSTEKNPNIRFDIEGLATFSFNKKKYLIASIQGNFSYALFDITKRPKYIESFVITDGVVDGVEDTDGLDVCICYFGEKFNKGILVVQDGFNINNEGIKENQNFKIIDIQKVFSFIK